MYCSSGVENYELSVWLDLTCAWTWSGLDVQDVTSTRRHQYEMQGHDDDHDKVESFFKNSS